MLAESGGLSFHQKIAEFVQGRLKSVAAEQGLPPHEAAYRWEHSLRVTSYGRQLAGAEGANVEAVVIGCLMHDVALLDPGEYKDHGRLGAAVARPFLEETGCDAALVEMVCTAIADHADIENPETLEAKVVTDADNVDRFGALRAVQRINQNIENYPALIADLRQRVEHLKGYRARRVMQTDAGHTMFNQQLDRQIAFFEAIIAESEITCLP